MGTYLPESLLIARSSLSLCLCLRQGEADPIFTRPSHTLRGPRIWIVSDIAERPQRSRNRAIGAYRSGA